MFRRFFYRKAIDRALDEDGALSQSLELVLQKDSGLRSYYLTQKRIVDGLRGAAEDSQRETSPFLTSRIMNAIDQADLDEESNSIPITLQGWASAFATLAIACALGVMWFDGGSIGHRSPQTAIMSPEDMRSISEQVVQFVGMTEGYQLQRIDQKLNDPLEAEIHLAMSDARNAIGSLANAFLPSSVQGSEFLKTSD